jgi:hypothetical protein
MSLHRLVYFSANEIAGSTARLREEVDQILETSRRNNALVGVTGALMFSAGYFGQVLEGPQAAIEMTFERIQQDDRHANVSLLEFVPIATRTFESWAMAFVGEPADAGLDGWQSTDFNMSAVTGELLLSKLHSLVARSSLAA